MRLKLEWDDNPTFATVKFNGGDYRAFTLKIDGKAFSTWVHLDIVYQFRRDDPDYMRAVDEQLIGAMERMLGNVFSKACGAITEGTDLMIEEPQS